MPISQQEFLWKDNSKQGIMQSKKLFIFDLDDTLIESARENALAYVAFNIKALQIMGLEINAENIDALQKANVKARNITDTVHDSLLHINNPRLIEWMKQKHPDAENGELLKLLNETFFKAMASFARVYNYGLSSLEKYDYDLFEAVKHVLLNAKDMLGIANDLSQDELDTALEVKNGFVHGNGLVPFLRQLQESGSKIVIYTDGHELHAVNAVMKLSNELSDYGIILQKICIGVVSKSSNPDAASSFSFAHRKIRINVDPQTRSYCKAEMFAYLSLDQLRKLEAGVGQKVTISGIPVFEVPINGMKPLPTIPRLICENAHVPLENAVMVGNSPMSDGLSAYPINQAHHMDYVFFEGCREPKWAYDILNKNAGFAPYLDKRRVRMARTYMNQSQITATGTVKVNYDEVSDADITRLAKERLSKVNPVDDMVSLTEMYEPQRLDNNLNGLQEALIRYGTAHVKAAAIIG